MSNSSISSFIKMVVEENLVQAQAVLKEQLNQKLVQALNEKFETFAPTLFEEPGLDPVGKEDEDINNDGKVDGTDEYLGNRRAAIGKAMGEREEDVEEDEEQSEEEEEGESEDEDAEETDEESEETEEEDEE